MRGREFLELARELLPGTRPRHWRAITIHAYYGLLLECRDVMTRWGLPSPGRQQVHGQVRLRLTFSSDPNVKRIGLRLEELGRRRNWANYDLQTLQTFSSPVDARQDVQFATDALALLDAIDADPARRADAVASIRP